ncbi:MAG: hypothetical protein FJ095_00690 [Deltaproteobacteria bacterium]|nr:hypothetical protein [Deltaproteobacteria bacterium]
MTSTRIACALLPALLSACWQVTRPAYTPLAELEPLTPVAPAPVPSAPTFDAEDERELAELVPPARVGPSLRILELVGVTPAAVGAMLAPAVEALERCRTSSTGKLVLRLVAEPGRTHVHVVDKSGVDADVDRCALSAVGTVEVDESIQQSWSPIDAVHRIETQLVLSW